LKQVHPLGCYEDEKLRGASPCGACGSAVRTYFRTSDFNLPIASEYFELPTTIALSRNLLEAVSHYDR